MHFGSKAKTIKTTVNLNEIVKESHEEIANKMFMMNEEIEALRLKIRIMEDEAA